MSKRTRRPRRADAEFLIANLIISTRSRFTQEDILEEYKSLAGSGGYTDGYILSLIEKRIGILKRYGYIIEGALSYQCA